MLKPKPLLLCLLIILIAGCASLAFKNYNVLYGSPKPKEFSPMTMPVTVEYERDVRPVLEKRCVVCHGCYDAPCQLKMESYEGILRGANKNSVYNASRLSAAKPSRLFEDAQSTSEWRSKNFFPVLNERANTTVANQQASLMFQMLDLKRKHPLPDEAVLPDSFDFSLERNQQCAKIEEFDDFASKYPLWGMPYGFPAIPDNEHKLLQNWLRIGAPSAGLKPLSDVLTSNIAEIESFLNKNDLKHQLVARYIYEHLFLAHMYLEDQGQKTLYFKLVRSRTAPGQPIDIINTRRPYEDPKVDRVYYRIWQDPSSIVAKTHMPYQLNNARLQKWQTWFIDPEYEVSHLPDYAPKTASNPFITFQAIPPKSRYQFLLEEAQFTIMNFIKGPVCRGSMALNVIQDHFWVFFTDPNSLGGDVSSTFLASQDKHLNLPAEFENSIWSIRHWRNYSSAQLKYLKAKSAAIQKHSKNFNEMQLETFWTGDKNNSNAALTVFRHYDSASVVKGLVGNKPKTAWLIDYPILERIHYLLVAGYDVFGNASHQVMTRLYMDFLRMESEMNFVMFLPEHQREKEISKWYQGAHNIVDDYLNAYLTSVKIDNLYEYKTKDYKNELLDALSVKLGPILNTQYDTNQLKLPKTTQKKLQTLQALKGMPASILSQTTIIHIQNHGVMTILSNSAYSNISSVLGESNRRRPGQDSLTAVNGIIGSYPSVILDVPLSQLDDLLTLMITISNEADYKILLDRFGVRRTNPRFWDVSDAIHSYYRENEPLNAGILDYNRYNNR